MSAAPEPRSLRQAALDVGVNVFAVDLLAESVLRAPWCESLHARAEPMLLPWPVQRGDTAGWWGVEVTVRPLKEGDKLTPAVKVDNSWAADAEYASWFPIAPTKPADDSVWLVVREHAMPLPEAAMFVAERDREQLVYLLPASFTMAGAVFGSFAEASAFIRSSALPLGWVARQVRVQNRRPAVYKPVPRNALGYTMGDWFRDLDNPHGGR